MQKMIWAVLLAFLVSLLVGPVLLPVLRRLKFGQNVYNLAPESHQKKQGTPTMGGLMICLVSVVISLVLHIGPWDVRTDMMLACLALSVGNLFIGFADDMAKIRHKQNGGLTPRQKLIAQTLLAIAFAFYCYAHPQVGDGILIPFLGTTWHMGWLYVPMAAFAVVSTTNSANLLDGLDGLLGSVALVNMATFGLLGLLTVSALGGDSNQMNVALFCCAVAGACMGFLRFNVFPARLIMGDTGSMFIGGAVVSAALLLRQPLIILIAGFCMVASSLSVLIQRLYFKLTHGKRIFKMSPIHHHFELSGVPETKIVAMYTLVTVILCLISLLGTVRF